MYEFEYEAQVKKKLRVEKKEKRKALINTSNKQDVKKKYTLFKNCNVNELNSPCQWQFKTYRKNLVLCFWWVQYLNHTEKG